MSDNESEAMEVWRKACDEDAVAAITGGTRDQCDQAAARVIATALEARDARIRELEGALNLAANRLDRLTVEFETGTLRFIETAEWADETRAILTKGNTHDQ